MIEENGTDTPYIICDKGYHGEGNVTLIRKYLVPCKCAFDRANYVSYAFSTSDVVLSTMFILNYSNYIKKSLLNIGIEANVSRKVFLPSLTEMNNLAYFKTNSKVAKISETLGGGLYLLRTPYGSGSSAYSVHDSADTFIATKANAENYLRPMIVLPEDMDISNIAVSDTAGYKISEKKTGIYVFNAGAWGEVLHGDH